MPDRPVGNEQEGSVNRFRVVAASLMLLVLASLPGVAAAGGALQATAIPTVTGTPEGPMVIALEQVNVRDGPGILYNLVSVLVAGQRVPALGRSPGGDWIQISYPGGVGWVYSFNVTLEAGAFPMRIIEPPPSPTPRVTSTIDPTLAAQFPSLGQPPATRLPTYTPAAPVPQPTFPSNGEAGSGRGFPPVLAIFGLLVVGSFGMVISILRGR
jgi:hypothetical protein